MALLLGTELHFMSAVPQTLAGSPATPPQFAPEKIGQAGVIKVQASSVVVDVIVTDRKGRHVSGLAASDFAVSDNGVPQKVVAFEPPRHEVPGPPAAPETSRDEVHQPPVAPSLPQRQAIDVSSVHFITLVLDLGGLEPGSAAKAREAAAEYVRKTVASEDFVAVYRVDHTLHLDVPFTRDKQRIIDAMDRGERQGPRFGMR